MATYPEITFDEDGIKANQVVGSAAVKDVTADVTLSAGSLAGSLLRVVSGVDDIDVTLPDNSDLVAAGYKEGDALFFSLLFASDGGGNVIPVPGTGGTLAAITNPVADAGAIAYALLVTSTDGDYTLFEI